MEFRQLQTFVTIAQEESFSRAAELLGYSQSAVTVQIRQLEEELKVRLFDRMGKKTVLTGQGRRLLEYAGCIIREVNRAKAALIREEELMGTASCGYFGIPVFFQTSSGSGVFPEQLSQSTY